MCEEIKERFLAPKEYLYKESDLIENFYIAKNGASHQNDSSRIRKSNQWLSKDENGNIFCGKSTLKRRMLHTQLISKLVILLGILISSLVMELMLELRRLTQFQIQLCSSSIKISLNSVNNFNNLFIITIA